MGKIHNLLNCFCPKGVVFRKVKDIAEIGTGSSDRKDAVENGRYPLYVRSKDIIRSDSFEFDETAIVIPGEGAVGDVFHFVEGKYALHQRAYRIHIIDKKINSKFAFYYFSNSFKEFIISKAVSATVTSIRKPMIEDFRIPAPPLVVQDEIVRILDNFTVLTAELTARQKQYSYYMNAVLSNVVGQNYLVGDLFEVKTGKGITKKEASIDGDYPIISGGKEPMGYYKEFNREANTVTVSRVGANAGFIMYIDKRFYLNDKCFSVIPFKQYKNLVNPRYLYYFLKRIENDIVALQSEGGVPTINTTKVSSIKFVLPSMDTQQKIVDLLDSFNTYCSNLYKGLPAEISARQKQYEFYRDKLLTFKELEA